MTTFIDTRHLRIVSVGIGRAFLYAYSSYGQPGVEKALQILHVRCPSPLGALPSHPDFVNHPQGRIRNEHALARRQEPERSRAFHG